MAGKATKTASKVKKAPNMADSWFINALRQHWIFLTIGLIFLWVGSDSLHDMVFYRHNLNVGIGLVFFGGMLTGVSINRIMSNKN